MNMRELLIATSNSGKVVEIRPFFKGTPFEIHGLEKYGKFPDIEEVGETFEGNALIKALIWGKRTGILTMAEDSGLVVDALHGRPGVYSARYPGKDWQERCQNLIKEMQSVPEVNRSARFIAVVAVYDPKKDKVRLAQGICEGSIAHEPIGTNGFGFDPIFRYNSTGKTGGEMSLAQKNQISHRGLAVAKAKEILLAEFA